MADARSNAINSISSRLTWRLNHLNFVLGEEISDILGDVFDLLILKHEKLERLHMVHENIEKRYMELAAETEQLRLQIAAVKQEIELEEASQATLKEEAKRQKLDRFYFNSVTALLAARGLLPPNF